MPDLSYAFRPFPEQIAFFQRKVNVPTLSWDDLMRGDHAHGFMVAGAARAELLEDFRQAVAAAIDGGESLADFRARFEAIVARHGWTGWRGEGTEAGRAWRARVIWQTNLRTSYMAGRWQQLQGFPYLRYQHNTVLNPREQHQAWDGMILRRDDPWWSTHYPPNGWGCRCSVTGISEARLRSMGKTGPDPTPEPGPGDPPPEWAYHVGEAARSMPAATQFGSKVMALPQPWREIALADAQRRPTDLFRDWPGLVDLVVEQLAAGAARPRALAQPLGFLPPGIANALEAGVFAGQPLGSPVPGSALLSTTDTTVFHVLRDTAGPADAVLRQALRELPQRMADPQTLVLWDVGLAGQRSAEPALVYAWPIGGGRYARAVFRINATGGDRAMRLAGLPGNWLRTMGIVERYNLDEPKYILLGGGL